MITELVELPHKNALYISSTPQLNVFGYFDRVIQLAVVTVLLKSRFSPPNDVREPPVRDASYRQNYWACGKVSGQFQKT